MREPLAGVSWTLVVVLVAVVVLVDVVVVVFALAFFDVVTVVVTRWVFVDPGFVTVVVVVDVCAVAGSVIGVKAATTNAHAATAAGGRPMILRGTCTIEEGEYHYRRLNGWQSALASGRLAFEEGPRPDWEDSQWPIGSAALPRGSLPAQTAACSGGPP
jgi:hypothetical protein